MQKNGSLGRLPRGLSDLMLRLCASIFGVCTVCCSVNFGYMVCNGGLLLLVIYFGCSTIPSLGSGNVVFFAMHTYIAIYMPDQQAEPRPSDLTSIIDRDQRISYNRDQLMAIQPARMTKDLISTLPSLEIGTGLPRKRYHRALCFEFAGEVIT